MAAERPQFQTTRWTNIRNAVDDPEVLTQVIEGYWWPIYAFLRSSGMTQDEARDLTQAFVCERFLKSSLLERADPAKGRFRSYLLTALKNFVTDDRRRNRTGAAVVVAFDPGHLVMIDADIDTCPETAFHREWARAIFQQALTNLEVSCRDHDQSRHWRAFQLAHPELFAPGIEQRPSNGQIADQVGARDAEHVSMLLHSVRRKFRAILRDLVAESIDDPEDVDREISELRALI